MERDPLAQAAVEPVTQGMLVGLGTGRAAARAIHALAFRVERDGLLIHCVATSEASANLAASLGLRVLPMDEIARVDYLFDGADEVDASLRMIKGRGGAMTREKIVARAATRRIYLVQQDKVVRRLGEKALLPIEVLAFGFEATRAALGSMGLRGEWRLAGDSRRYLTDNGNPVLDAPLPSPVELDRLREALDAVPGVVGHGLFLSEADEVLVEGHERGDVSRMIR
ncbi:MAG: ribose-5-phosphate isomerase RpiA [Phycisphaerae bacterium]|nr:ribose-5-phosphate isomerase RpiA [Phycisphaerae bacterium]